MSEIAERQDKPTHEEPWEYWKARADSLEAALASSRKARARAEEAFDNERMRNAEAHQENTRLRAALAQSKSPCVYCSLPVEEWAKCQSGFPGCDRADDAMGCPELGAAMRNRELEDIVLALEEALKELDTDIFNDTQEIIAAGVMRNKIAKALTSSPDLSTAIRQRIEREAIERIAQRLDISQIPNSQRLAAVIRALLPPDQAHD